MNTRDVDVWTVSIMLRTEGDQTRADAFLQGPEVEAECSGWAETPRPAGNGGQPRPRGRQRAAGPLALPQRARELAGARL